MKTRDDATAQAATALTRLVLERIVLSYAIGSDAGRVVVSAKISAQDEFSRARAKRRIQAALDLVTLGTAVVIESAPPVVLAKG